MFGQQGGRFFLWFGVVAGGAYCLFFGFILASEVMIRTKVLPADLLIRSFNIQRDADEPQIAVGDSITARGFHGRSDYFNLAFPGDNVTRMAIRSDAYLSKTPVNRVILQATYNILRRRPEETRDIDLLFQKDQLPLLLLSFRYFLQQLPSYWHVAWEKGTFRSDKYLNAAGEMFSTDRSKDNQFEGMSEQEVFARFDRTVTNLQRIDQSRLEQNKERYQALVEAYTAQGIEVCLVRYPLLEAFRTRVEPLELVKTSVSFFQALSKEPGVSYVDLSESITDPDHFMNEDHLAPEGALVFAEIAHEACFEQ